MQIDIKLGWLSKTERYNFLNMVLWSIQNPFNKMIAQKCLCYPFCSRPLILIQYHTLTIQSILLIGSLTLKCINQLFFLWYPHKTSTSTFHTLKMQQHSKRQLRFITKSNLWTINIKKDLCFTSLCHQAV